MEEYADLHIHTNYSDSSLTPRQVIEQATEKGLKCISIADHDTVDGIDPTMEEAKEFGIEVLTGIELSTEVNGRDLHVLGYLFDHKQKDFISLLSKIQDVRVGRMDRMIEKLKGFGIDNIELDEVCSMDDSQSQSVGRPHLAQIMVEKGWVKTIKEAFDKYLADGAKAYVEKYKLTPKEAIELIKKNGGVSVLAHPMMSGVDEMIPQFVRDGLDGIEAYCPNTSPTLTNFYKKLAQKYDLIVTGGSDAHGETKKHISVGCVKFPYEYVEIMKERARKKN